MNNTMTTYSQLSTTEPKKTKTKQAKQTSRTGIESQKWDHMEGYQWGGGNGGKVTGNKKHKWQIQNRQEEANNSVGNGETKELIYTTHDMN